MEYNLALQLKNAGFLQHYGDPGHRYYINVAQQVFHQSILPQITKDGFRIDYDKEIAYVPTLSELIEACGSKFGKLTQIVSDDWCVFERFDIDEKEYNGSTPEEAVAKLWLTINENKKNG